MTYVKTTVTPSWLKQHLDSRNLAVLDSRSKSSYSKAHIPGSRNADLFHYFVPGTDPKNLAVFHRDLQSKLSHLGLKGTERTIVYETGFGMRAARVAWMLEYAGLKNPLILEGGYRAWTAEHYPSEKGSKTIRPTDFEIHPNPKILATADYVNNLSKSNPSHALDVRSQGEYRGSEKRECCPRPGRVPGASWIEWTRFLGDKKGFLDRQSIKEQLRSVGIRSNSDIAIYCHRGARAASVFYALRSIGYAHARNYVGSWHEWSSKRNLPAQRG